MNCEDFHQRLIDYLYGEISVFDRRAVDQHLAECSSCRVLAKSFEHTLLSTRASLAGPLHEPIPARIHERILCLAQETAVQGRIKSPPTAHFLSRMVRKPWFLPVCGAATIGAFLLLVRPYQRADFISPPGATHSDQTGVHPSAKKASPVVHPTPQKPPRGSTAQTEQPSPPKFKNKIVEKAPPSSAAKQDEDRVLALNSEYAMAPGSRVHTKKTSHISASQEETAGEAVKAQPTKSVSVEKLQQKANRHFLAERWSEAIEAYQSLIHRFPQSKDIAKWRERLYKAMAEEARDQTPVPAPR